MNQNTVTLDSFDRESFKVQLQNAIPQIVTEMSDLFERPTPRITKRDRQEMSADISWSVDVSVPKLLKLENINGEHERIAEGYQVLESLLRTYLRRAKIRLKPNEDSFDCFLRKSAAVLKPPYLLRRRKQFRVVRAGIDLLVRSAVSATGGMDESQKLIEEFGRKHFKEYMRFANTIDARLNAYQSIDLARLTQQNVTRLTDLYRDMAAAFETRLRLVVGLNFIAKGDIKAYDDLRACGYNVLLQAVDSVQNPLLHFLNGAVDRHVRNALMHGSVSSSLSKGVITFVNYAPHKKKETVIVWKMSELLHQNERLLMTVLGTGYLEQLFGHYRLWATVGAFRYLCANAPAQS